MVFNMWLCGLPTGVLLHLTVLRKGEWDLAAHKIFYCELFHISSLFMLARYISNMSENTTSEYATSFAARYATMHAVGLLLSMTLYRVFFHRLKHFPGPILGSVSNFYLALSCLKKWRLYEDVQALHAKYGDYVRVGPNQLSIADPAAISIVYNSQSCNRGPICNLSPRRYVYSFDRNKATHQQRRRPWVRAFGQKAIPVYDSILEKHVKSLERFLETSQGRVIDVRDIMEFVSFDITFETVYGMEAGCVVNRRQHRLIRTIKGLKAEIQPIQHLPWVVSLGLLNPWPQGHYAQLSKQSDALVEHQLKDISTFKKHTKQEEGYRTAFKYFFDAFDTISDHRKAVACLKGDSDLTLIAGWDNTASSLVAVLYHLSQSHDHLMLIREELEQKQEMLIKSGALVGPDKTHVWAQKLSECVHLNAAINEAMRLHPGLPRGSQRQTPPEGLQIGDKFIPGNVVIHLPQHTMSHDKRSFVDPDAFRPERWTTHRELVKDASVFMPFGVGMSPCPGKLFAMRILRVVLADMVLNWDFQLAPGVSKDVLLETKHEKFNTGFGSLEMTFHKRT